MYLNYSPMWSYLQNYLVIMIKPNKWSNLKKNCKVTLQLCHLPVDLASLRWLTNNKKMMDIKNDVTIIKFSKKQANHMAI